MSNGLLEFDANESVDLHETAAEIKENIAGYLKELDEEGLQAGVPSCLDLAAVADNCPCMQTRAV